MTRKKVTDVDTFKQAVQTAEQGDVIVFDDRSVRGWTPDEMQERINRLEEALRSRRLRFEPSKELDMEFVNKRKR